MVSKRNGSHWKRGPCIVCGEPTITMVGLPLRCKTHYMEHLMSLPLDPIPMTIIRPRDTAKHTHFARLGVIDEPQDTGEAESEEGEERS